MFSDFEKEDFARVMLVQLIYADKISDLLRELVEFQYPLDLLTKLVNIQRYIFDLPSNTHKTYSELFDDAVITNDEYASDRNLWLVFAVLVVEMKKFSKRDEEGRVVIDMKSVVKAIKNGKKFLERDGYKVNEDLKLFIDNLIEYTHN